MALHLGSNIWYQFAPKYVSKVNCTVWKILFDSK